MKKILGIFILLLVLIPFNTKALEDYEAPTLSKITFSSYTLTAGENVTIYVEGNDNLTGIGDVGVELRMKSDHSKKFALSASVTPGNNVTYTRQVPNNVEPGEYEIFVVQVWDAASNLNTYYIGSDGFPFERTDVTVNAVDNDYTAPTIISASVTPQTTKYPENFTINATVEDDKSQVRQVEFVYKINGKEYTYILDYVSGNNWSLKARIDEHNIFSDAIFVLARVYDEHSNQRTYYKEDLPNLDVIFTDKIDDKEEPQLHWCSYSSNVVSSPGSVEFTCSITDDKGIGSIRIQFKGYNKEGKLLNHILFAPEYDKSKKIATEKYTFSQYEPDSEFFISQVDITDISGKHVVYSVEQHPGTKPLEKKILTLKQAIVSDVTISATDTNYAEKIETLKEGETITIDTTSTNELSKSAFDKIKGKNNNIIVVNDGIQWVFNGLDIKNPTKKINTKISVYKINKKGYEDFKKLFDHNNDAIVINFADNGLLPGKALIKIKADYTLKDYIGIKNLYVYHVISSEDGLEAIAEEVYLGDDGYYSFYITHNSKYIISKNSAKESKIVKDSITELGNTDIPEIIVEDETTATEENEESVETTGESIAPNKKDEKKKTNYFYIIIPSVAGVLTLLLISTIIIKNKKKKNTNVPNKENNNKKEKSKIKNQK